VDPVGSEWEPVVGSRKHADEPAGSGATEFLVSTEGLYFIFITCLFHYFTNTNNNVKCDFL
jgi:hypothetical protein